MLNIHQVTPEDLPAILRMIEKLCAFHGDTCQMDLDDAQAQFIAGPLVAFIAHEKGLPVGYLVLEPHWRPMHGGPLVDIAHLFVEEAMRGRGIGRALIAQAQQHAGAIGACRLVIGTAPDNPTAAAVYNAMGFAQIMTQPGPRFEVGFG
jgi:GNAT superfamily N-acetyltransferase